MGASTSLGRSVRRSRHLVVPPSLVTVDATRRKRRRTRARVRKPRRRKGDIDVTPVARSYFRDMSDLLARIYFDLARAIKPRLEQWVQEGEITRDAAEDELDAIIDDLRAKYTLAGARRVYADEARETGIQTTIVNRGQVEDQLSVIGIDIYRETPQLTRLLTQFTAKNARLITSLADETLTNAAVTIESGIAAGLRHEEIAASIFALSTPENATPSQVEKSEKRAALIARNEVLTMSAQLTKARQMANGIEEFIWRTVGDGRVRDLHEPREGDKFTWATGASGGDPFPGSGINCRCFAEPVL